MIKPWIKAFRLRTLPLSFSNILLGSSIAYSRLLFEPSETKGFSWKIFGLTLLTTLLLQILSNLANDYGDSKKGADNENRIGPKRAIQSGEITPQAMLRAIIIVSVLCLMSGLMLLYVAFSDIFNWTFIGFFLLGLAAIAAAIKYTVGKGAYGYSGLGDLFVFLFFGLVGVMGSYYLQVKSLDLAVLLPAVTMGCFSVAVLNLNNMRDRENDASVGKNTIVVKLGANAAKMYHYGLFILAYLVFPLPLLLFADSWLPAMAVVPVGVIHVLHLAKVHRVSDPKDFDPELKKIALSAFLFSILLWVAVILDGIY